MGIVADVQAPDLETRVAILKKSAQRSSVSVSDEVLMYLAQSVTSNIRELEGAFLRVIAYAGIVQRPIDQGLVDQVLKDFFRENPGGKVTISWIQKKVAEYFDIPESEMLGKRRSANLVLPRQVAMKLSQMMVDASLSEIGGSFGGRDHTTVMHAIDKIQKMMANGFGEEFERIKKYVTPHHR
jgi:chromosomal replication initiator protein